MIRNVVGLVLAVLLFVLFSAAWTAVKIMEAVFGPAVQR